MGYSSLARRTRPIYAAVDVAQKIRNGAPPPTATGYPAMQACLVEFDRLNQTG
ncbi:MAG: hypothetical protein QOI30_3380 [Mycobacterium sp.]|nr:hypothetical protein [Mycobacterium sp.]